MKSCDFAVDLEITKELIIADDDSSDGWFWHKGFIKPIGGTKQYKAWMLICQNDCGEHWETIVEINNKWYMQSENSSELSKMGIIPYHYRLLIPCPGDIHSAHQY